MSASGKEARRWWREPLPHFLLLGVLLFLLSEWLGDELRQDRIVVTPGRIESLSAAFSRTWQRPPTRQELAGLIDDYVREEIAAREALAMGLDQDDVVIRRRLRQKLEFLTEDSATASAPSEQELQDWLDAHPDPFRTEPEYAFRQVFLDPAKHGDRLDRDVARLLERLQAAGEGADIRNLGDSLMVPRDIERMNARAIARVFGDHFSQAVTQLEPDRWTGPVQSEFGQHLVYLHDRRTGPVPPLSEIRPQVQRAFQQDRRRQALDGYYAGLRERYPVVIEMPQVPDSGGAGAQIAVGDGK